MGVKSRTLRLVLIVAACCGAVPCLAWPLGCEYVPLTEENLVGTWKGKYTTGGEEVIVIRADGTYEQTYTRKGTTLYRNSGAWSIGEGNTVWFHDSLRALGFSRDPDGNPRWRGTSGAAYSYLSGPVLFFSNDNDYFVRKQTSDVPPDSAAKP